MEGDKDGSDSDTRVMVNIVVRHSATQAILRQRCLLLSPSVARLCSHGLLVAIASFPVILHVNSMGSESRYRVAAAKIGTVP